MLRWPVLCSVLFLIGGLVPQAHASADRVSFFHDITVNDTEEVDDAVCFLCSIRVDGKLSGDAVAFLGGIHLNGEIGGDVVSFFGDVAMSDESRIDGDCVVFGGPIHRRGNSTIGGDTVNFPLILVLLPFIVLGLMIYGLISFVRRRKYAAYPMPPPPIR